MNIPLSKWENVHDTLYNITGDIEYPESLLLTSKGSLAEDAPYVLGVYRKLPEVMVEKRPVWKNVYAQNYIFSFGNTFQILCNYF